MANHLEHISEKSTHNNYGIDKHIGHNIEIFFRKFWISLILSIPVILYSDIFQKFFKWAPPDFIGSSYMPLLLSSIIFFYGGWIFIIGAWREIRSYLPGMMTLISIAISTAYFWSIYAVFAHEETLFWEIATLITIMFLGHYIEMRTIGGTQNALRELAKLLPDTAEIIQNDKIKTIAVSELNENDIILVRPGAQIPADGKIIDGESNINESMVTGESNPVFKKKDDFVVAGTINGDGALKIRVTNIGEKTFLAGVIHLVNEAQMSKSRLQVLSDKAALFLTIIAILGGLITLTVWLLVGANINFAVARLVAVLVIACPHALGLAVPLVASISTTKAAQNGFLVKQRIALETARTIDAVLFDKTGTLTKGEYGVIDIFNTENHTKKEVLELAASLNLLSEHPISKAVLTEAKKQKLSLKEINKFEALRGKGIKAFVGEKEILIGGFTLLESNNINVSTKLSKQIQDAGKKGQTIIFVIEDKILLGAITLADVIRKESYEAILQLKEMGIQTIIITGDGENTTKWVSQELGIDKYFAKVLPHQKSEKIKELQALSLKVAMVGDGINDALALTQADLGIAIGAGTNVAIESAGIVLIRNDPRDIEKIIKLSKMTYSKMIQNIFWATGYNIIALPLAAGIFAFKGILLQPAISAIFMSLSTIIVALNALLLKNKNLN